MANLKIEEVAKDPKLLPVLKAYMSASHTGENYDFYFSKESCEKLYPKFISSKSATQVNLPSDIQKKLDDLAKDKKWADMASPMMAAKKNIGAMVNADVMPRFMLSKEYLAAAGGKEVDLGPLKAKVAVIEKDINDGTAFVNTAMATVKAKGKPADPEEVNRMFQSMRMRHDKVHEAYTKLLQTDKDFTKANFGPFFAKKDAFTKLCMEYRKLLGK